jgi:hypothetical protein
MKIVNPGVRNSQKYLVEEPAVAGFLLSWAAHCFLLKVTD